MFGGGIDSVLRIQCWVLSVEFSLGCYSNLGKISFHAFVIPIDVRGLLQRNIYYWQSRNFTVAFWAHVSSANLTIGNGKQQKVGEKYTIKLRYMHKPRLFFDITFFVLDEYVSVLFCSCFYSLSELPLILGHVAK